MISIRKPKNRLSSSSIKDIPKISSKQRSVKSKINLDIQSSKNQDSSTDVNERIPLVLTYHPTNNQVKNVIFENYPIISTNLETRDIFDQPPLLS